MGNENSKPMSYPLIMKQPPQVKTYNASTCKFFETHKFRHKGNPIHKIMKEGLSEV